MFERVDASIYGKLMHLINRMQLIYMLSAPVASSGNRILFLSSPCGLLKLFSFFFVYEFSALIGDFQESFGRNNMNYLARRM